MTTLHICALLLASLCHPAESSTALLIGNIALTTADLQGTYELKSRLGPRFRERDPLGRPFILNLPKPAAMSLAIAGDVGVADLGDRMRKSARWYRHVWWAPQVALGAANVWGVRSNVHTQHKFF